jgi:glycosyltransferase involved in cell wall biosynthesis
LADALAETQLVVVPATRSGFSPTAATAMAHGRPVLMRSVGGLPDMGVAGQSAAFFEQDEQLGERIADLLQTPMRLRSMADAAALRAKLRFDPQKCVEQYLGIYRDL